MLYFCIFITGACSLVYQIVWQKYLAILLGSEATSIALVVGVFLSGLAAGYYLFGHLTALKSSLSRRQWLKLYAWVEVATATQVILFPSYFFWLKSFAFANPSWWLIDITIALLTLALPTLLMGATIPLMTTLLPTHTNQISTCHAKIYGWNTLGAFAGCLVGGLLLVPAAGLVGSLYIAGALNMLVGLFYLLYPLKGPRQIQINPPPHHTHTYAHDVPSKSTTATTHLPSFGFFVFLIGLVSIALEILLIRSLSLTIGSSVYVFSICLAQVVLGIGWGSLSVEKKILQVTSSMLLHRCAMSLLWLAFVLFSVPYWPSVINHIRVSLATLPTNLPVFLALVFCSLGLLVVPLFFYLGQLLPLAYRFSFQNQKLYGKTCGRLYFFNTLGAATASLLITYAGFVFFNLEVLFKIVFVLLILATLLLTRRGFLNLSQMDNNEGSQSRSPIAEKITKAINQRPRIRTTILIGLGVLVWCVPEWNRTHHERGVFRNKWAGSLHFKKFWLGLDETKISRLVLEDGPNSTISILKYKKAQATPNTNLATNDALSQQDTGTGTDTDTTTSSGPDRLDVQDADGLAATGPAVYKGHLLPGPGYNNMSIIVNGKSDGNSWGDFLTTYLLALLPYVQTPGTQLNTAVVGFGTGITAGSLGLFERVASVKVLEISQSLIRHHHLFDPVNFGTSKNKKIQLVPSDAFRFFTRPTGPRGHSLFDIVISEPSNPWVIGVENLFTQDFYQTLHSRLSDNGTYAGWFHTYSMNNELFADVLHALTSVFQHVRVFYFRHDMVILARKKPFLFPTEVDDAEVAAPTKSPSIVELASRFNEAFIQRLNHQLGLQNRADLNALLLLNEKQSKYISLSSKRLHTLQNPFLCYEANKAFFLGSRVQTDKLIQSIAHRILHTPPAPKITSSKTTFPNTTKKMTRWQDRFKIYLTPSAKKQNLCHPTTTPLPTLCNQYRLYLNHYNQYNKPQRISTALASYTFLRDRNLIAADLKFLTLVATKLIRRPAQSKAAQYLITEFFKEGFATQGEQFIHQFAAHAGWKKNQVQKLRTQMNESITLHKQIARLRM